MEVIIKKKGQHGKNKKMRYSMFNCVNDTMKYFSSIEDIANDLKICHMTVRNLIIKRENKSRMTLLKDLFNNIIIRKLDNRPETRGSYLKEKYGHLNNINLF